ncbi:MAG: multicopper oxidase domain-containing protein [Sphingobacteriales bacterium]|nr:multicopper oxidase domain-containing protein [Sphingobacteriales bacterium]
MKNNFTRLVHACLGFLLGSAFVSAQNLLTIPDTLSGTEIQLNIQNGSKQIFSGNITQTMGINGPILAPTIILNKHQNVTMRVKNNLSDTTTIHWHGMHVAPQNDGGPHITILPGKEWSPSFEVLDHASTHWYHPHLHYKTYDQVQMGIAGFIIVRDSLEAAINLPRKYGVDDFPIAIQSKGIDANNQIITAHTALDSTVLINGTYKPFLNAPKQVIRLRLLNGSPERVYNIGFSNNQSFYQIGGDGGLLSAPVALTRLLIAPGERAEILINLADVAGSSIQLMNYGTEIPNARYGAAQPGMGAGQTIPGYTSNPLNGANFSLLNIQIGSATSNPVTSIPSSLIAHNPWPAASAQATRNLVFMSMNMGPGAINGPFTINDAHFDMDVINFKVPFNNIEIWELRNQTPIAHPFHIHNVSFYILDINGAAPPANMRGRKDVVLVPGGNGVVRFITKFEDFFNDTLPYMYHCHMLTHEDDGMMGQFVVNSPCSLLVKSPENANVVLGATAIFKAEVSDTVSSTFQWQSNIGFGFQDLENAGQYSGVKTRELRVSNVGSINNNQQFRCKIANANCDVISETAIIQIGTSSLLDAEQKWEAVLYPNPAKDILYVKSSASKAVQFVISNTLGQTLAAGTLNATLNHISVENLPKGVYIIQLTGLNQTWVERFVKE